MGALRYLARGVTFDDLAELSDVGESTLNTFAHEYYSLKAEHVCHCKYIHPSSCNCVLRLNPSGHPLVTATVY
jgi:hypothetical protein